MCIVSRTLSSSLRTHIVDSWRKKVWSGISGGVHLTCFKCKKDGHAINDFTEGTHTGKKVNDTNNNTRDSSKDRIRVKPLDGAS